MPNTLSVAVTTHGGHLLVVCATAPWEIIGESYDPDPRIIVIHHTEDIKIFSLIIIIYKTIDVRYNSAGQVINIGNSNMISRVNYRRG